MSETVNRLTAKIVQIDGDQALCEDGSLWGYHLQKWTQLHPPHKPPTQAADLAEALEILRSITYYVRGNMINLGTLREIVAGANKLLDKHGA